MYEVVIIFLLFMIYSFIGWLIEVLGKIIEQGRFINRGFLIGPYCPIYGIGCLLIIYLLENYNNDLVILFFMSIIICSLLEYITSYLMEKIFKARWWDYSTKKFNLNGRICLDTLIPFGFMGVILVYIVNPMISVFLYVIPSIYVYIASIILFIIFISDLIISFDIIFKFRNTIKTSCKDGTEEISKKVRERFAKRGFLFRRLLNAFPNVKSPRDYLEGIQSNINDRIKRLKKRR